MTTNGASDIFVPPGKLRQRPNRDITWAIIVVALFAAHIAFIVGQACPYWSICFPFTPLAPYLWPIVAIALAIQLIARALFNRAIQPRRLARMILALLLIAFATDTLTGGDYRWFEIAMRREMRKCGGPTVLQQWAQNVLTSPQTIASFEERGGGGIDPKALPPELKSFASAHTPIYRQINSGGPWFMFAQGGWDMG